MVNHNFTVGNFKLLLFLKPNRQQVAKWAQKVIFFKSRPCFKTTVLHVLFACKLWHQFMHFLHFNVSGILLQCHDTSPAKVQLGLSTMQHWLSQFVFLPFLRVNIYIGYRFFQPAQQAIWHTLLLLLIYFRKFNKNIELREMKSFALAPPKSA